LLLWFLIGFGMWAVMMMLGYWPELQKHVQNWLHRIP
jgi:hypothetical protein